MHRARPDVAQAARLVVKIGSALLVDRTSGALRRDWLHALALDVAEAKARGTDVIMVSSGSIAIGRGVLGLPAGDVQIDWHKVIFNMLTLKGVYGREIFETWYKMQVFIQSGLDLSPIITHRLPADDFEQGFEAMLSGEACKVVLNWEDQ